MPEGPEVKIASDYFNHFFFSCKKIKFELISEYYHKKYFEVFNTVNNNLKTFKPTFTIGKNIFVELDNNQIFNFHLGMTGGWSNELVKHCHFRVFDNDNELFYRDVRKFGKMKIITKSNFIEKFNSTYDLLHESYNFNNHLKYLEEKISVRKSICSLIMDQKYFPGVGNYIKSEALYASKIHPEEKWGNLNTNKKKNLIKNLKKIMYDSYKAGGAELKDFNNPFHISKFKLKIYGQKYTDKNNIVTSKLTTDSRKTWFCTKQQTLIIKK